MDQNDPRVIARHEAAHALVLAARGVAFESIEVFTEPAYLRDTGAAASACVRLGEPRVWWGEDLEAKIISSLASLSVERMLCRDVPYWMIVYSTCRNDYAYAEDQCELYGFNIHRLQATANKMVRRLNPIIRRLGDELLGRRRMTYEEVIALCPEVAAEGSAYVAGKPERQAQLRARFAAMQKERRKLVA